jgi:hypothetical protein
MVWNDIWNDMIYNIWYDMIWSDMIWYDMIYDMIRYDILTAIEVDSRWQQCSTHIHTNSTQNNTNDNRTTQITTNVEECGPCPDFAKLYPGIWLTTEEKTQKYLSQGKKNLRQVKKNLSQSTVHILPKHTHILQNPHTHTHTLQNNIKPSQYKLTTNTVQDIPKWNYRPQYKNRKIW